MTHFHPFCRLLRAVSAALFAFIPAAYAQRQVLTLADSWRFIKQDEAPDARSDTWEAVSVPHTWNAVDGQNGKKADAQFPAGYYRGPAWYVRKLDVPADWKGRRIFLKFDAASLVADAWINGKHLGQHRGGFTAFVFELTGLVNPGEENLLRVKVDNTRFDDIAPLSGDFTVFGGLYRPVHLIVTDEVCVTPQFFGSAGVFLTNKKLTAEQAVVELSARVSNGRPTAEDIRVEADVLDDKGKLLQTFGTNATLGAGKTEAVVQNFTVDKPVPWAGRPSPYLYAVRVRVLREGKVVDEVIQPLGLRTVQITEDRGFLLNGKPYRVHGVNRHQELKGKGWALSSEDDEADFKLLEELGATGLRLAHYPQNSHVLDLADKRGLIVWEEIPLVNEIRLTERFNANALQQLQEMIYQGWNHPSIAFWGIYNELFLPKTKEKPEDAVAILTRLRDLAHQIDPSRPVVAATHTNKPLPIHRVPDWQAVNTYPGWYWTGMDQLSEDIDKATVAYGKKRTALSEYGAGGNPFQHQEGLRGTPPRSVLGAKWTPESQWHPEEYQTLFHISQWSQAKNNPALWGTFIWAMFDFAADSRDEGAQPGINDKGLVTHDRKVKKDAYYFYKANWNPEPMVYLASRRHTTRKNPMTDIMVFANAGDVELKVNGRSLGKKAPNDVHVAAWENVQLQPGLNHIEAMSIKGNMRFRDTCEWVLQQ